MVTLFIGVVSHEGTRFRVSLGTDGLGARLAVVLADLHVSTQLQVNTANMIDQNSIVVSDNTTRQSMLAQLRLEKRWARFLKQRTTIRWWGIYSMRWLKLIKQFMNSPGAQVTERLVNIELSHLDLLRAGTASQSDWILILEDDAAASDIEDCAAGLFALMTSGTPQPQYVNLSRSFATAKLGIGRLLVPAVGATWQGRSPRVLLAANRPVTNTVCAILYRRDFAVRILNAIESMPMEPVVPIDWKMNMVLMDLYNAGELVAGDCWMVEPAPIVQMSMHSME